MKYWIGTVSREHVKRGEAGNFIQLCHGKAAPLKRMQPGDWLIYYSPKEQMKGGEPLQKFTAICQIKGNEAYQVEMFPGFCPFRLDVEYQSCKEVEIRPLLDQLNFVEDPKRWGAKFRFGHFEIDEHDFMIIKNIMLKV